MSIAGNVLCSSSANWISSEIVKAVSKPMSKLKKNRYPGEKAETERRSVDAQKTTEVAGGLLGVLGAGSSLTEILTFQHSCVARWGSGRICCPELRSLGFHIVLICSLLHMY